MHTQPFTVGGDGGGSDNGKGGTKGVHCTGDTRNQNAQRLIWYGTHLRLCQITQNKCILIVCYMFQDVFYLHRTLNIHSRMVSEYQLKPLRALRLAISSHSHARLLNTRAEIQTIFA